MTRKEIKQPEPLACGHAKTEWRIIHYRCTIAPICRDTHSTAACQICFDAGERPKNFGRELVRYKA